jgi:cell fate (sporulation/competence/biofilm development) regulator YlbF (YheA/YmcA/DUF963 family)
MPAKIWFGDLVMDEKINEMEVALPTVVRAAGRDFAAALAETPQFKAFERAYMALKNDTAAQKSLSEYQAKVKSLREGLIANAISETERAELERLKNDYLTRPTVEAYNNAEAELTAICQQAAGMISSAIGSNYAAACGASCCG